jgi:hypothetical protein
MLDVPAAGRHMLVSAMTHLAEVEEDSTLLEESLTVLEAARLMVEDTPIHKALRGKDFNHEQKENAERMVMRSLLEADTARRMI